MKVSSTSVRVSSWILVLGTSLLLGALWVLPPVVILNWAVERARDDPYAQFEARHQAEALIWLLRIFAPVGLLLFWPSRRRSERVARWMNLAAEGLRGATLLDLRDSAEPTPSSVHLRLWVLFCLCLPWVGLATAHFAGVHHWILAGGTAFFCLSICLLSRSPSWILVHSRSWVLWCLCLAWGSLATVRFAGGIQLGILAGGTAVFLCEVWLLSVHWRTWVLRSLCLAWGSLAIVHFVSGVDQRTRDWAYYRLDSGATVLPNISESNRMVIRHLNEATPEDARILVLSDQKLFFVSYYLLPRRVYHPMHPDAEFVIPQANQQRQLSAYRLADLDDEYLARIDPDYIVEYFEGPESTDAGQQIFVLRRWIQEDDAP